MNKGISRTNQILFELLERDTCISGQALSKKYHCSERTIRNEIDMIKKILESYHLDLTTKKNQGYIIEDLNDELIIQIKKDCLDCNFIPNSPDERTYYILKRLLLTEKYITVTQLAEELYISKVSITYCLKRVKEILKQYHLLIENKPHYGLGVKGKEEDFRKCIIEHGINYDALNFQDVMEYKDIQETSFFNGIDLSIINYVIKEEIKKAHISFYDMFYNNLVIHIAVAIKRIQKDSYIEQCDIPSQDNFDTDIEVAHSIALRLGKEFDIIFPDSEINYMAIHLIGNKIANVDEDKLYLDDIYILVNKLLLLASQEYDIDFMTDEVLKKDLYLHLKSALSRVQLGICLKNPMIQQIKDNYPFPFEIAIHMCCHSDLKLNILSEEEIGYIVIHFAAALERLKEKNKDIYKKKVLIFCASGIGTVRLLEAKLKSEFKDLIEITSLNQTSYLDESKNDYDLILSTIPISIECQNFLIVNAIPTKVDMTNISKILYKKHKGKIYQVEDVLNENLFLIQNKVKTKKELLNNISQKLYQEGYVDQSFYQNLIDREEIVDTGIGELFAIPHPLKNVALKNGIFICILKEPVLWSENKMVQVLFVLVIKRSSAKYFEKIYDLIVHIASDIEIVNQLISCNQYEEVLKLLKELRI